MGEGAPMQNVKASWTRTTTVRRTIEVNLADLFKRVNLTEVSGEGVVTIHYPDDDHEMTKRVLEVSDLSRVVIKITSETDEPTQTEEETF